MITPVISNHRDEIRQLCRRFNVRTLEVFGSAATPRFDAEHSDLDFIVSFADESFGTLADRYLDLAEALEHIFERPVDLLTERSLRNPYFIQEVNQTRQTIYEQPGA
ncbi:MAG: nucleotidyltransferase domain-containing protein [Caldilineaceae bacterium]